MPVRYILNGGHISQREDKGEKFFKAVTFGKTSPKILVCLFGFEENERQNLLQREEKRFLEFAGSCKPQLILAEEENFPTQVRNADILFIKGGNVDSLIYKLSLDMDWVNALDGKTLAATGSGVCALSYFYLDLKSDEPRFKEGFRVLKAKLATHYTATSFDGENKSVTKAKDYWRKANKILKHECTYLPVIHLKEGEILIF